MRFILGLVLVMLPLTAAAKVPHIVTDIPPVYGLTQAVMGDVGAPILLLTKGADEHDFQLRPSQMQDIASADLVIWIGPQLTPWLDRALSDRVLADRPSLALLEQPGTLLLETEAGINPHAWLNPKNGILWLDMIAAALSQADPDNAAQYSANAAAEQQRLMALDAKLSADLSPLRDAPFVTYHDAYAYVIAQYGLTFAGSLTRGDAAPQGAAHVHELQAKIAENVVCVFPEAQHDSSLLMQLLDGTQARAGAALDPIGSTLTADGGTYAALLSGIAKTLVDCLSGA